jgi:predicted PurR-regulated permease PerM
MADPQVKPDIPRWSEWTKRLVIIIGLLVALWIVYISRPILPVLVIAAILAFLMSPLVNFLNRRLRLPRGVATTLAYLFLFLIILLIPILIVPASIEAVRSINIDFIGLGEQYIGQLQVALEQWRTVYIFGKPLDLSPLIDPIQLGLQGVMPEGVLPSLQDLIGSAPALASTLTGAAYSLAGTVSAFLLAFLFTMLCSLYLALDLPNIHQSVENLIPEPYVPEYRRLKEEVGVIWSAYFRGQVVICLVAGLLTWVGFELIGLPGAFLLGLAAAILQIIPNLGPILALIPAIVIALIQGSTHLSMSHVVFAFITLAVFMAIQQVIYSLIVPRVIGEAVGVPVLIVLLGVVVGASVGGLMGAFLAVPLIASGRVLAFYAYNKIRDRDPFPKKRLPAQEDERGGE